MLLSIKTYLHNRFKSVTPILCRPYNVHNYYEIILSLSAKVVRFYVLSNIPATNRDMRLNAGNDIPFFVIFPAKREIFWELSSQFLLGKVEQFLKGILPL